MSEMIYRFVVQNVIGLVFLILVVGVGIIILIVWADPLMLTQAMDDLKRWVREKFDA